MGKSKVASAVTRDRLARIAAMTLEQRFALLDRMREDALGIIAARHRLDRRAAIASVKAGRRFGRRGSASASADDH